MISWRGAEYLSVAEVAAVLGRTAQAVYALIHRGGLPARVVLGKLMVLAADLDAAVAGVPMPPAPSAGEAAWRRRAEKASRELKRRLGVE
jgi:excisionase family DNA binding protein